MCASQILELLPLRHVHTLFSKATSCIVLTVLLQSYENLVQSHCKSNACGEMVPLLKMKNKPSNAEVNTIHCVARVDTVWV